MDKDIFEFFESVEEEQNEKEERKSKKKKQPKYKLDLFKQILPELDRRNYKFYYGLSLDQKKEFASKDFVILRYMSSYDNDDFEINEYFIEMSNNINKNFWNSSIKSFFNDHGGSEDFGEFQCRLLSLVGMKVKVFHPWLPMTKNLEKDFSLIYEICYEKNRLASRNEIHSFIKMNTDDDLVDLAKKYGWQDVNIKDFKDELKKLREILNDDS